MRRTLTFALLLALASPGYTQIHGSSLSDGEVEQIREAAYFPAERILLFVKFLDLRTQQIQALYARGRRPGREQDTHDLIEQFTSIADELDDNLDDYGPRHSDIRRALPKLVEASERWATAIKTPPDNDAYNVSRRIALESIRDVRQAALKLTDEQVAWFKAHPPAKEKEQQHETIDIPR